MDCEVIKVLVNVLNLFAQCEDGDNVWKRLTSHDWVTLMTQLTGPEYEECVENIVRKCDEVDGWRYIKATDLVELLIHRPELANKAFLVDAWNNIHTGNNDYDFPF